MLVKKLFYSEGDFADKVSSEEMVNKLSAKSIQIFNNSAAMMRNDVRINR